jgi:ATP-dependent exoDNAse (exonuclease V) beta subunit
LSRKIFKHRFVPFAELTTETINGQRHYVLPDGVTKLKSVTTVLSEKTDKTALMEWKARVGHEEAQKISTQAARRGTAIHSMAERYIMNEPQFIKENEMPVNIESFKPIRNILDQHVDDVMGVELPLYSKALKCAGRTDLIARYDGTLSVIDFKTSRKLKRAEWIESYFLQSTVYSMMFEWTYRIAVPQIVIIITVDNETTPQVFKLERSQFVNRVLEIFTN